MSARKGSSKKRAAATATAKSPPKVRVKEEIGPGLSRFRDGFRNQCDDNCSDLKGIMSALHQFGEKTEKEETIPRTKLNDLTSIEKNRQSFVKAIQKSSKECENYGKSESAKIQDTLAKFAKEKAARMQSLQDTLSRFEEDQEKLVTRYEQLKKKEKSMLAEHWKAGEEMIAKLQESLKKMEDVAFNSIRKTLFLDDASDGDFPLDD
ncbi:unnamed protein product [Linum tenue]|uniref:Uncharacterized protein n=1 Tax=Linum tenue TaxID=586396 RepID=A0AAV0JEM4_9ROSI|nr:unnamed protein product [Linum tenue]